MIKVGIVGISGYSGKECLDLLLAHKEVRLTYVSAGSTKGKVSAIWPDLKGRTNLVCEKFDVAKAKEKCELIFLAVPHTTSMKLTPKLLKAGMRVIDLSGDYRLKTPKIYEQWYKAKHTDRKNLSTAVYGLPELFRENIKKAQLVANPGCYPTAAILSLAPIVSSQGRAIRSIIIDAKSGVTGAGRKAVQKMMYAAINENFRAYKVLNHQHTPEINQYLSAISPVKIDTTFIPHLLPVDRGILETIYVQFKHKVSTATIQSLYRRFYKTEKFVRILEDDVQPELKDVVGTNYCDIALKLDSTKNLLVITAAIDNLVKGAAGQAVQNMNIMAGFKESTGLL